MYLLTLASAKRRSDLHTHPLTIVICVLIQMIPLLSRAKLNFWLNSAPLIGRGNVFSSNPSPDG